MVTLITDPELSKRLIARRRATGADHHDEVWEGMYVMSPDPTNRHQSLVNSLATILTIAVEWPELGRVFPGVNVSDRRDGWKRNYRIPDVAVFLAGTQAVDYETHWFGGPDFLIEVVSPHDRARKKLPFYEKVGVREVLLIDRDPWRLTLYRQRDGRLRKVGRSGHPDETLLRSEVLPLDWRMKLADGKAAIEILHHDGAQRWLIRG